MDGGAFETVMLAQLRGHILIDLNDAVRKKGILNEHPGHIKGNLCSLSFFMSTRLFPVSLAQRPHDPLP